MCVAGEPFAVVVGGDVERRVADEQAEDRAELCARCRVAVVFVGEPAVAGGEPGADLVSGRRFGPGRLLS